MEFQKTQTFLNLARAFAAECQAGMRYQLIVQQCMKEQQKSLANTIRTIAKNETNHARVFFESIQNYAGSTERIRFEADYPFHAGSIGENLKFAAEDEREESDVIYPAFAAAAREEGFEQLALKFEQVAAVEDNHRIIFGYLHEAFENGSLYRAERPMLWICGECGYMHTSKECWNICPLCGAKREEAELHLPFKKENI